MKKTIDTELFLGLYRSMRMARRLDETEAALGRRGDAAFYLAGSGHEATAALASHLGPADWLHPHYRGKALILARGLPVSRYLHNLFATAESDAQGRRMPPFVCDRALHLLSIPTLVGNNALQAVGVAAAVRDESARPVVLCGMGDGGSQQGEVLEAIAEAVRARLPVLFLVEDNGYALSTPTRGHTFYSRPDGEAESFYGVPIRRLDGSDAVACWEGFGELVRGMREDRGPRLAVMRVERLSHHSNSDDETMYRGEDERRAAKERGDPLPKLAARLRHAGVSEAAFEALHREVDAELETAVAAARTAAAPLPGPVKRPLPAEQTAATREYRGSDARELTLLEAMRETLRARLAADPRVTLFGQDIEDPKGDVFGLTRGLSRDFPDRVRNAPLTESTIVGESIGRALAGGRPVAFLQFADFFPVAYNQLASELGSLYWRTAGQWEAPVIVMAITGAYRPGLGPFHAQSPEAVMAHIPGVDVFMPSNATDAAGLLNAAFDSGRPTVFLYPKNLLNDPGLATSADVAAQFAPVGHARLVRGGQELTLVGWGNTVSLCERVAEALEGAGRAAEVIDLRSLSPWDREAVVASAERTGRLLVVHEDMRTCGLGAEVAATVAEAATRPVAIARVTTPDTFLPFHYGHQLDALPSFRTVLERAAAMLDLDVTWTVPEREAPGVATVRAIGSSPSDEMIRITGILVKPGAAVKEGDLVFSAEAEKAAFDIAAPASGTVREILVKVGDEARVGTPILRLATVGQTARRAARGEPEPEPVFHTRAAAATVRPAGAAVEREETEVVLSDIASAVGAREMSNESIIESAHEWSSEDILQRTGIERRYWVGPGESALTLAVKATRELLDRERLLISDIDVLICSTGTPLSMTPSMACRILKELSPAKGEVMVQAYDINAACSGYLYALQSAWDYLKSRPAARIVVVTTETLSPLLDHKDAGTLFLFGDAATASLVARRPGHGLTPVRVNRPVLSAKGEEEKVLCVPLMGSGEFVRMEGQQVFRVAVRKMIDMLEKACEEAGVDVGELAMIVPHQANTRIIEAIRTKIKVPPQRMFNHIREYGNTSSNTIPLALQTVLPARKRGDRIGLCAFGGGFTFGAAIIDRL